MRFETLIPYQQLLTLRLPRATVFSIFQKQKLAQRDQNPRLPDPLLLLLKTKKLIRFSLYRNDIYGVKIDVRAVAEN